MADWQIALSNPFQLPGATPGQVVHLRKRANGNIPAGYEATAVVPASPNAPFGIIVGWPQLNQSAAQANGTVIASAGGGSSWGQGSPILQNNGAGLRGRLAAGYNGSAGENRIGWKSTVYNAGETILARSLDYCFALNGYDYLVLHNGSQKAAGTMQPDQRLMIDVHDTRIDYFCGTQLLYTEPSGAPQALYYPAAFFGGVGGSAFHEVRVQGNLARPLTYQDYVFGPGWTGSQTSPERTGTAGEWLNTVRIYIFSGIRLNIGQGRGIEYRIKLNGEIQYAGGGSTIDYEVRNLTGEANYLDLEIKANTYVYFTPGNSVLFF
jgi:hypothetical protein